MPPCLICGDNFSCSKSTLEAQTNVVFLLQNILGVPSTKCVGYLGRWGNPCQWINLCPLKCHPLISSALHTHKQITELSHKLDEIKGRVVDGIRKSSKAKGKGQSLDLIEQELREIVAKNQKINGTEEFAEAVANYSDIEIKVEALEEESFEAFDRWEIHPDFTTEQNANDSDFEKQNRIKTAATPNDISAAMETTSNGKFICNLCPKIFGLRKSLRNHQNTVHNLFFKRGRPAGLKLTNPEIERKRTCALNWKEIVGDPNDETSYSCATCAKTFKTKWKIKRHFKEVHLDKEKKAKKGKTGAGGNLEGVGESSECLECGQTFWSKLASRNHNLVFHSKLEDSGQRTRRLEYLQLVKEVELTPWKCAQCFRWFPNHGLRDEHQRMQHGQYLNDEDLQFPCEQCGSRFFTPFELSLHKEVAHGGSGLGESEARFSCQSCPSRFVEASRLEFHLGQVHGILTNPKKAKVGGICPICGLASNNFAFLYSHMKLHRGDKTFPSNSTFSTNSFLEIHKTDIHGNANSNDS